MSTRAGTIALVCIAAALAARPDPAAAQAYTVGLTLFYGTAASPVAVAIGDLNGDGKLDMVSANINAGSISVLLGNSTGVPESDFLHGRCESRACSRLQT
jgi:hypothetical protein